MFAFFTSAAVMALVACGGGSPGPEHQAEWREILEQKKVAASPEASPDHRQRYADSVRAFVTKHPNHSRAREVWNRMQLEFADDLMDLGRAHEAVRFYRSVLRQDPANTRAAQGWETAAKRLAVGKEKLAQIERGMSQRQVASLLGRPMPGWTLGQKRRSASFEAWYFRSAAGGIAAVYFRDGCVIAAEQASNEPVRRGGT